MTEMQIAVELLTVEAQVGTQCICGGCHPTATVYRDDPQYERHDSRLAHGPCCCGRFFAIGDTLEAAQARAEVMSAELKDRGGAARGFRYDWQRVSLPWGAEIFAVVAYFSDDDSPES